MKQCLSGIVPRINSWESCGEPELGKTSAKVVRLTYLMGIPILD